MGLSVVCQPRYGPACVEYLFRRSHIDYDGKYLHWLILADVLRAVDNEANVAPGSVSGVYTLLALQEYQCHRTDLAPEQ
jgi:hypothetical protein